MSQLFRNLRRQPILSIRGGEELLILTAQGVAITVLVLLCCAGIFVFLVPASVSHTFGQKPKLNRYEALINFEYCHSHDYVILNEISQGGCAVAKVVCCSKIQKVRLIQAKAEKEARQSCSVKRSKVSASVPEFRSMGLRSD